MPLFRCSFISGRRRSRRHHYLINGNGNCADVYDGANSIVNSPLLREFLYDGAATGP